jgi:GDP-L-fucose synthase
MNEKSLVFVAGHRGLVGSAIVRALRAEKYERILTIPRGDVDLTDRGAVRWYFSAHQPEYVFLAAAKVGGIVGNSGAPVEFLLENLKIQNNVIEAARDFGVKKLLFLGSGCAYPKHAKNPVRETALLSGPLEPSNAPYALAKIAGITLCQAYRKEYGCDFISAMPTNLYGEGDHYDLQTSHVIPGMIRRIHEARSNKTDVTLWGTGNPVREFLYSDDMAQACLSLMRSYSEPSPVNITSGVAITLRHLAEAIARVTAFTGEINWDTSKPDGTPDRRLDGSIMCGLGWLPEVGLEDGLARAYKDFLCQ